MSGKTVSRIILAVSLTALLLCMLSAAAWMSRSAPTYDGSGTPAMSLYENPDSYDASGADGAAAVIVGENRQKTAADNVVYSVVFNFRGYDTLGESFILIGAIAGTMAILRREKKKPGRVVDYRAGAAPAQPGNGQAEQTSGGIAGGTGAAYRRRPVIMKSACDFLLPLSVVYGWYIILHGAFSPGGGFQGGVLAAGAVLLIYLAYGLRGVRKVFHAGFLHTTETLAEIFYILVAVFAVPAGYEFCRNFIIHGVGETTMLMNDAVGYHVMAGICCLLILMLEALGTDAEGNTP